MSNTNLEIKSKVIESANPDYNEVIRQQEYKDGGGGISCGHDFWKKKVRYGDVVLCNCCHQYFTKIRHLPWVVKGRVWGPKNEYVDEPHTNHIETDCYVVVDVRITD